MNIEEKIKLLAEVLEIDASAIEENTELASLSTWDSMTALALIVLLEEHFERSDIDGNQIKRFKIVADILNVMEK